ncbi:MAG: putative quinol monooxygenase [Parvularculales bacterium]
MSIGVVATLTIQDGKQEEFESIVRDLRAQVKASEPECLMYDAFQSQKDKNVYVFMERYSSQEALEAHGKTEHFRAAGPKLGAVLAGAPIIDYLNAVDKAS